MRPRPITDSDLGYWASRGPQSTKFTAPGEEDEGIEPCPAVVLDGSEIAVPWVLNEIEMAALARGGTLWLVTRHGLPIHGMHVQAVGEQLPDEWAKP